MLNIEYDFTELPSRNLDYFIPLNFQIDPEERVLMDRALAENSVVVAQMTPFYD